MTQEQIIMDIQFVKKLLPEHYEIKESKKIGSIHCKSPIGIRESPKSDKEDQEHWNYIVQATKQHFGKRFQEIDHNTNFCHVDFTIYLKRRL